MRVKHIIRREIIKTDARSHRFLLVFLFVFYWGKFRFFTDRKMLDLLYISLCILSDAFASFNKSQHTHFVEKVKWVMGKFEK